MKFLVTMFMLLWSSMSYAGDFSLIDQNGVQHQMSWYARTPDSKIVVVSYDGNLDENFSNNACTADVSNVLCW